jgi:hypothetical protein
LDLLISFHISIDGNGKAPSGDAKDRTDPWSDDNGDLQGHRRCRGYDQRLVGDPERNDSRAVASAIERMKELPGTSTVTATVLACVTSSCAISLKLHESKQ